MAAVESTCRVLSRQKRRMNAGVPFSALVSCVAFYSSILKLVVQVKVDIYAGNSLEACAVHTCNRVVGRLGAPGTSVEGDAQIILYLTLRPKI
jgi:hypothetical protein